MFERAAAHIPAVGDHALESLCTKKMELIEVQSGSYLIEGDIVRLNKKYRCY